MLQGAEIMDVALCGGGDPNQGYTNTAVQLSAAAVAQVKAAIFMGDPLFRAGLSYEVGTCEAGGVRLYSYLPYVKSYALTSDNTV